MNFQEASEIAKCNPGSVLTRDEFGGFCVRSTDGNLLGAPLSQVLHERNLKILQLERELSDLRTHIDAEANSKLCERDSKISQLEKMLSDLRTHNNADVNLRLRERDLKISQLERELSDLQSNIEAEVNSRLKPRLLAIEAAQARLNEAQIVADILRKEAENNLRKFKLLEAAYAKRFGAAEINKFKETVESPEICSRCGGDGLKGRCENCGGTGWVITEVENIREEVIFK